MEEPKIQIMTGVTECGEGDPVELYEIPTGRLLVTAWNEGHNACTHVDLVELIRWVRANMPELLA